MPVPARVSLRRRLQQSSLLAVLAGYGVLLTVVAVLLKEARTERHRRGVEQMRDALIQQPRAASPAQFQARLDRIVAPGRLLWLELESGEPFRTPLPTSYAPVSGSLAELLDVAQSMEHRSGETLRTFSYRGRHYLCSSLPLMFDSRPARLRLLEDVTDDQGRIHTVLLLLTATAGLSALITSGLLRLVLSSGLLPLDRLSQQLVGFQVDRLAEDRLSLEGQPNELMPIVAAFNGLLDRLAAGRQRQQSFVDGVAHELRTPITLISGYAQSLERAADAAGRISAQGLEPLRRIVVEADRMGRLVSDLLDLAREDGGRLELQNTSLDLDDALLEAYERLEPLARGRLRIVLPGDGEPPLGHGDRQRMQQCLTNLIENALKYTPAGSQIELFSSSTPQHVIAHVRDHGPGVPEWERKRIFQRFVRGSAAASGSGLGLSIVQLLMERMGGAVEVVEASGGGAEFRLQLTRVAAINSSASPPEA